MLPKYWRTASLRTRLCILFFRRLFVSWPHLENQIWLKSIVSILCSGISDARRGALDWILARRVNWRQEDYVNRISSIICTHILGTSMAPSQWRFPLTEEGAMGILSNDNNRTWTVMNMIEVIIEACLPTADTNKNCCYIVFVIQSSHHHSSEERRRHGWRDSYFSGSYLCLVSRLGGGVWKGGLYKLHSHVVVFPCLTIHARMEVFASLFAATCCKRVGGSECAGLGILFPWDQSRWIVQEFLKEE